MPNKRIMKKQFLRWILSSKTRAQRKLIKKNHIDWNREILTITGSVKSGIKNYYRHMVYCKAYINIIGEEFKKGMYIS